MTNVIHAHGTETIWSLTDRRLSRGPQILGDDARKVMFLETPDGVAIISYAGLGRTALKTEPSDWMAAVLRGRKFPLEYSLGLLAEAMKKELPRHLNSLAVPPHHAVVSAFLDTELKPRLYTIDLVFSPNRKWFFRYTQHKTDFGTPPRFVVAGSGSQYLVKKENWQRQLLRLIRACDRGQVSPNTVADYLASVNNEVTNNLKDLNGTDSSVGPRCVVTWRHQRRGIYGGGGGHQCYCGTMRESNAVMLPPTIVNGMDLNAIFNVIMPDPIGMLEAAHAANDLSLIRLNTEGINAKLERLPHHPDQKLR